MNDVAARAQKVVQAQGMCGEIVNGGRDVCILAQGHGEHGRNDACVACGAELTRVFDGAPDSRQYDTALDVTLSGGYGMFFDDFDGDHRVFLCHDCAHKTCEAVPWLAQLITPERSHAHNAEFWAANPNHVGWDRAASTGDSPDE